MIAAVSMVKDEADVIVPVVRHMLSQVDRVIVADNGSTDGTRELLEGLAIDAAGALTIQDDPEQGYYQSRKMSALADTARRMGATWVVPFDADEIWVPRAESIKRTLESLPYWVLVAEAALYDYVATGRDNGATSPFKRMTWRRSIPAPLPKVACRLVEGLVIHQGNHGATFPDDAKPPIVKHLLTIRHYPLRSVEQMIRKVRNGAAAYKASDLPEDVGGHWRRWGEMSDDQLREVFHTWYWREDPTVPIEIEGEHQPALVEDPALGG